MLAVVQWASRDGGSPRLPTRSTPPLRCASAVSALAATSASDAQTSKTIRRFSFDDIGPPPDRGEPIYHTRAGGTGRGSAGELERAGVGVVEDRPHPPPERVRRERLLQEGDPRVQDTVAVDRVVPVPPHLEHLHRPR